MSIQSTNVYFLPSDGQTFRYSIKNILVEPMFFHTFTLSVRDANTTLLTYMEDTCDNMALFKK